MYYCDSHLHTHFSFDGAPEATVNAVCLAAIARGLSEITVTDHCDINGEVEGIYAPYRMEAARDAVMDARAHYAGRLQINWGVELGQPHQYPEAAKALIDAGGFDFVLGSLHNLTGVPDFWFLRYEEMSEVLLHQLFARALQEMVEVVRFPGVHALAHLTYPLRYAAMAGRKVDLAEHIPAIRALFAEMIARGIALEVNYSTLRAGLGFAMPDEPILRLWREMGGERITLGSDAHRPADLAGGLDEALALLQRCGFHQIVTYRGGQPYVHSID